MPTRTRCQASTSKRGREVRCSRYAATCVVADDRHQHMCQQHARGTADRYAREHRALTARNVSTCPDHGSPAFAD